MWEARLWLALDHETPVDIVSTMGPDIEVEQLLELYCGLPSTGRDHRERGSAARRMMLRVRVDSSASAECWVTAWCRLPLGATLKRSSRPCGCGCSASRTRRKMARRGARRSRGAGAAADRRRPPASAKVGRRRRRPAARAVGRLVRRQPRRQPPLRACASRARAPSRSTARCSRSASGTPPPASSSPSAFARSAHAPPRRRRRRRRRRHRHRRRPPATPARTGDSVAGDDALSAGLSAAPSAPLGGGRAADDALLPPPRPRGARTRNSAAQFRRAIPPRTAQRRRPARPRAGALDQGRLFAPAAARPAGGGREPGALPGATHARGGGPSAVTPNFPAQVVRRTLGEVAAAGLSFCSRSSPTSVVEINERCDLDQPLQPALRGRGRPRRLRPSPEAWRVGVRAHPRRALGAPPRRRRRLRAHAECARALIAYGAGRRRPTSRGTRRSPRNTAPEPACAPSSRAHPCPTSTRRRRPFGCVTRAGCRSASTIAATDRM